LFLSLLGASTNSRPPLVEAGSNMAKKWCGFLPQNQRIMEKWGHLAGMQDPGADMRDPELPEVQRLELEKGPPDDQGELIPICHKS
jgi:hypothetical protein